MTTGESSNRNVKDPALASRREELFVDHRQHIYRQTDRLFVVLMVLQWIGGVIMALVVSPQTWIGATPFVHVHVWAAVLLGGAISSAPIVMGLCWPGTTLTRHVIAVAQAAWAALLIHLSGGRIETHFHIFGSLAFLAFYRDWRVLITATVVVAGDHLVRGIWWPRSVYGVLMESPFRWVEHAAWVVFEDIFLILSCLRGQKEWHEIAKRRASLELTNAKIEERVAQRTRQLEDARDELEAEFAEHRTTQQEREQLYSDLAAASRQAGMAEVATGVLHNVGNVLNSVNVSVSLLMEKARASRVKSLVKASDVISQHQDELPIFLTADERGRHFPRLFEKLAENLSGERDTQLEELGSLIENIDHIKEIVSMQQTFAGGRGTRLPVNLPSLVEEAMKISSSGLIRHEINVVRLFDETPTIITEKHKVLQILVNLISNAKQALGECDRHDKAMTVVVSASDQWARIQVRDNGAGILPEDLAKIFSHGFTTKKEGHGFGLHSSALAAQELGGSLSVHSDGSGKGAIFTLRLPIEKVPKGIPRVGQ